MKHVRNTRKCPWPKRSNSISLIIVDNTRRHSQTKKQCFESHSKSRIKESPLCCRIYGRRISLGNLRLREHVKREETPKRKHQKRGNTKEEDSHSGWIAIGIQSSQHSPPKEKNPNIDFYFQIQVNKIIHQQFIMFWYHLHNLHIISMYL